MIFMISGYLHEQSRSDRDSYVTINWDNIQEEGKGQFRKCEKCDLQGTKYDFGSIMHYGKNYFSKDWQTLTTIDTKNGEEIGQRNGFSYLDIVGINKQYCGNFTQIYKI